MHYRMITPRSLNSMCFVVLALLTSCSSFSGPSLCEPELPADATVSNGVPSLLRSGSDSDLDEGLAYLYCCAPVKMMVNQAFGSYQLYVHGMHDGFCRVDYGLEIEMSDWSWWDCDLETPIEGWPGLTDNFLPEYGENIPGCVPGNAPRSAP